MSAGLVHLYSRCARNISQAASKVRGAHDGHSNGRVTTGNSGWIYWKSSHCHASASLLSLITLRFLNFFSRPLRHRRHYCSADGNCQARNLEARLPPLRDLLPGGDPTRVPGEKWVGNKCGCPCEGI